MIASPDPSVRESLRFALQDEYELLLSGDPLRFEGRVDLALIDLSEPDLAPITQFMAENEGVPVVIISSVRDPAVAVEAMKLGAADYILKPFDVDRLREAVKGAMKRKGSKGTIIPEEREIIVDAVLFRGYFYYMERIRDLIRSLPSARDRDELIERLIRSVIDSLGVEGAFVMVREGEVFEVKGYDPVRGAIEGILSIETDHPLMKLLSEGRVLFEGELRRMLPGEEGEVISKLSGLGAHVYAPMIGSEGLWGAILTGWKASGGKFVQGELDLLTTMALQGAAALEEMSRRERAVSETVFLRDMLDDLTTGLIAVDREGRVVIFNGYARRLTGYELEEVIGQTVYKLGEEFASEIMGALAAGEERRRVESALIASNGERIPIGMNVSVLRDGDGGRRGAVAVFADLSHVERVEARKKLEGKMEIWAAVAAELEHLFKNPLVSIKTFAQLLPEKYRDKEFRERFYKLVCSDVDRMSELIDKFSTFSHPLHLERTPFDLNGMLSKVVAKVREREGIEIEESYGESIPKVMLDRVLFPEAMENVLKNCIEELDPEERRISVSTSKIEDILEGEVKALITIEYRRGEVQVRPLKGAGTLQFAIAERIIGEHGGLISKSDENGVSTVRIEFPTVGEGGDEGEGADSRR